MAKRSVSTTHWSAEGIPENGTNAMWLSSILLERRSGKTSQAAGSSSNIVPLGRKPAGSDMCLALSNTSEQPVDGGCEAVQADGLDAIWTDVLGAKDREVNNRNYQQYASELEMVPNAGVACKQESPPGNMSDSSDKGEMHSPNFGPLLVGSPTTSWCTELQSSKCLSSDLMEREKPDHLITGNRTSEERGRQESRDGCGESRGGPLDAEKGAIDCVELAYRECENNSSIQEQSEDEVAVAERVLASELGAVSFKQTNEQKPPLFVDTAWEASSKELQLGENHKLWSSSWQFLQTRRPKDREDVATIADQGISSASKNTGLGSFAENRSDDLSETGFASRPSKAAQTSAYTPLPAIPLPEHQPVSTSRKPGTKGGQFHRQPEKVTPVGHAAGGELSLNNGPPAGSCTAASWMLGSGVAAGRGPLFVEHVEAGKLDQTSREIAEPRPRMMCASMMEHAPHQLEGVVLPAAGEPSFHYRGGPQGPTLSSQGPSPRKRLRGSLCADDALRQSCPSEDPDGLRKLRLKAARTRAKVAAQLSRGPTVACTTASEGGAAADRGSSGFGGDGAVLNVYSHHGLLQKPSGVGPPSSANVLEAHAHDWSIPGAACDSGRQPGTSSSIWSPAQSLSWQVDNASALGCDRRLSRFTGVPALDYQGYPLQASGGSSLPPCLSSVIADHPMVELNSTKLQTTVQKSCPLECDSAVALRVGHMQLDAAAGLQDRGLRLEDVSQDMKKMAVVQASRGLSPVSGGGLFAAPQNPRAMPSFPWKEPVLTNGGGGGGGEGMKGFTPQRSGMTATVCQSEAGASVDSGGWSHVRGPGLVQDDLGRGGHKGPINERVPSLCSHAEFGRRPAHEVVTKQALFPESPSLEMFPVLDTSIGNGFASGSSTSGDTLQGSGSSLRPFQPLQYSSSPNEPRCTANAWNISMSATTEHPGGSLKSLLTSTPQTSSQPEQADLEQGYLGSFENLEAGQEGSQSADEKSESDGAVPDYVNGSPLSSQVRGLLFEKELTKTDTGGLGRIILPKHAAEKHLPPVVSKEGVNVDMGDGQGRNWIFRLRYWQNKSRMYVLEGAGDYMRAHSLRVGDRICFCQSDDGDLLLRPWKVPSSGAPGPDSPSLSPQPRSLADAFPSLAPGGSAPLPLPPLPTFTARDPAALGPRSASPGDRHPLGLENLLAERILPVPSVRRVFPPAEPAAPTAHSGSLPLPHLMPPAAGHVPQGPFASSSAVVSSATRQARDSLMPPCLEGGGCGPLLSEPTSGGQLSVEQGAIDGMGVVPLASAPPLNPPPGFPTGWAVSPGNATAACATSAHEDPTCTALATGAPGKGSFQDPLAVRAGDIGRSFDQPVFATSHVLETSGSTDTSFHGRSSVKLPLPCPLRTPALLPPMGGREGREHARRASPVPTSGLPRVRLKNGSYLPQEVVAAIIRRASVSKLQGAPADNKGIGQSALAMGASAEAGQSLDHTGMASSGLPDFVPMQLDSPVGSGASIGAGLDSVADLAACAAQDDPEMAAALAAGGSFPEAAAACAVSFDTPRSQSPERCPSLATTEACLALMNSFDLSGAADMKSPS